MLRINNSKPAILSTALKGVPSLGDAEKEAIYDMFDKYVDGGLAWVRKLGKEYIPSVDNNLTSSLTCLLQVCDIPYVAFIAAAYQPACCCHLSRRLGVDLREGEMASSDACSQLTAVLNN